jgi:hypothetical protein
MQHRALREPFRPEERCGELQRVGRSQRMCSEQATRQSLRGLHRGDLVRALE